MVTTRCIAYSALCFSLVLLLSLGYTACVTHKPHEDLQEAREELFEHCVEQTTEDSHKSLERAAVRCKGAIESYYE